MLHEGFSIDEALDLVQKNRKNAKLRKGNYHDVEIWTFLDILQIVYNNQFSVSEESSITDY